MKFLGSPHPYAIESRRGLSYADSGENMKSGTYRGAFWKMTLQDQLRGGWESQELSVSLRFRAWVPG